MMHVYRGFAAERDGALTMADTLRLLRDALKAGAAPQGAAPQLDTQAARTLLFALKALDPKNTGVVTHADLYQVLRLVQVRRWMSRS
jgi:hypothetical protein